jgi:hypothetical protein
MYQMDEGQEAVVLAWPAAIPHDAPPEETFRFEIGPPEGPASWSHELPASDIRRHLETADVVTFLVPAAPLSPGLLEARIVRTAGTGETPLYRAFLDIRAPGSD